MGIQAAPANAAATPLSAPPQPQPSVIQQHHHYYYGGVELHGASAWTTMEQSPFASLGTRDPSTKGRRTGKGRKILCSGTSNKKNNKTKFLKHPSTRIAVMVGP